MVPETDNVGPYGGGWVCNICRRHGPASEANYRHKDTQFDCCVQCYEKIQALTGDEPIPEPQMFVYDFGARKYWKPVDGQTAVTKENIEALIKGTQDKTLAENTLDI